LPVDHEAGRGIAEDGTSCWEPGDRRCGRIPVSECLAGLLAVAL